jgi:hypothetical protein
VSFESASRLRTSDALIDTPLVSRVLTSQGLSLEGAPQRTFMVPESFESIPVDQFAERTGMLGIDPGQDTDLAPSVSADFTRSDGNVAAVGSAVVTGYGCLSGPSCMGGTISDTRWPLDIQPQSPSCNP